MESYFCPKDRRFVSLILSRYEVNDMYSIVDWMRQNSGAQTRCQENFADYLKAARAHFQAQEDGVGINAAEDRIESLNEGRNRSSHGRERADDDEDYYEDEEEEDGGF
jgi:hypothetical protein